MKEFCEICNKSVALLRIHYEHIHSNDQCPCVLCGRVYKHLNSLRRHQGNFQGDIADFKGCHCDLCGKRYCNKYDLAAHKKGVHIAEELKKPFKCEYCAKSFVKLVGEFSLAEAKKKSKLFILCTLLLFKV